MQGNGTVTGSTGSLQKGRGDAGTQGQDFVVEVGRQVRPQGCSRSRRRATGKCTGCAAVNGRNTASGEAGCAGFGLGAVWIDIADRGVKYKLRRLHRKRNLLILTGFLAAGKDRDLPGPQDVYHPGLPVGGRREPYQVIPARYRILHRSRRLIQRRRHKPSPLGHVRRRSGVPLESEGRTYRKRDRVGRDFSIGRSHLQRMGGAGGGGAPGRDGELIPGGALAVRPADGTIGLPGKTGRLLDAVYVEIPSVGPVVDVLGAAHPACAAVAGKGYVEAPGGAS